MIPLCAEKQVGGAYRKGGLTSVSLAIDFLLANVGDVAVMPCIEPPAFGRRQWLPARVVPSTTPQFHATCALSVFRAPTPGFLS